MELVSFSVDTAFGIDRFADRLISEIALSSLSSWFVAIGVARAAPSSQWSREAS